MNGLTLKAVLFMLLTGSSWAFAGNTASQLNTQLGCMACHQGEADKGVKNTQQKK